MPALVNGMDAVSCKQPKNLTACFGYPIVLSNLMDDVNSPTPRMLTLVNGMDAVNYKKLRNLTACFGYPMMLSTWMNVQELASIRVRGIHIIHPLDKS